MRIDGNSIHVADLNRIQPARADSQSPARSQVDLLKLTGNEIKETSNKQDIALKCLIISRRIMAGDKVPVEDHRFLQKHDPELYGKAILMRLPKQDPHEYKRISEDDSNSEGTAPPPAEEIAEIKLDVQV
jgi:hypothetical protein